MNDASGGPRGGCLAHSVTMLCKTILGSHGARAGVRDFEVSPCRPCPPVGAVRHALPTHDPQAIRGFATAQAAFTGRRVFFRWRFGQLGHWLDVAEHTIRAGWCKSFLALRAYGFTYASIVTTSLGERITCGSAHQGWA